MGDAKVLGVPHDGLGVIIDFEVLAVVEALYICLGPVTQATYSPEASLKPKLRLRLMTTGPSFTSRPVWHCDPWQLLLTLWVLGSSLYRGSSLCHSFASVVELVLRALPGQRLTGTPGCHLQFGQ